MQSASKKNKICVASELPPSLPLLSPSFLPPSLLPFFHSSFLTSFLSPSLLLFASPPLSFPYFLFPFCILCWASLPFGPQTRFSYFNEEGSEWSVCKRIHSYTEPEILVTIFIVLQYEKLGLLTHYYILIDSGTRLKIFGFLRFDQSNKGM